MPSTFFLYWEDEHEGYHIEPELWVVFDMKERRIVTADAIEFMNFKGLKVNCKRTPYEEEPSIHPFGVSKDAAKILADLANNGWL